MSVKVDLQPVLDLSGLELTNTSVIDVNSQHIVCSKCDVEAENVTALVFKIADSNGINEFALMPASSIELTQLAVLFGTASIFNTRVSFSTLPGFEISFLRNSDETVTISFIADHSILKFMGLQNSSAVIHTTVSFNELEKIERKILSAIKLCA